MLGCFSAHSHDLLTSSIILKLALQSLRVLRTPSPSPSICTTRPAEAIAREGPGLAVASPPSTGGRQPPE